MTTTSALTARDTALIGCWARTTWRVARSFTAGTPDRPEHEGGTLHTLAADTFGADASYEGKTSGLLIYRSIRRGPMDFHRETVHAVTWTTVAQWLATWSSTDRTSLVRLDRERFDLEHTAEELTYRPATTFAETNAIAQRRHERMEAGDRAKIRQLDGQVRDLIDRYLTGDRSPADQLGFF